MQVLKKQWLKTWKVKWRRWKPTWCNAQKKWSVQEWCSARWWLCVEKWKWLWMMTALKKWRSKLAKTACNWWRKIAHTPYAGRKPGQNARNVSMKSVKLGKTNKIPKRKKKLTVNSKWVCVPWKCLWWDVHQNACLKSLNSWKCVSKMEKKRWEWLMNVSRRWSAACAWCGLNVPWWVECVSRWPARRWRLRPTLKSRRCASKWWPRRWNAWRNWWTCAHLKCFLRRLKCLRAAWRIWTRWRAACLKRICSGWRSVLKRLRLPNDEQGFCFAIISKDRS